MNISVKELMEEINRKGVENIRFIASFKTEGLVTPLGLTISNYSSEEKMVCHIVEDRYKIKDNYKISITPVEFSSYIEHYYFSDFVSLINKGIIELIS